MKALILAGGEGKRLRPLTNNVPKPLLEVGGKPIIEWQIGWMKSYGVDSFVISGGYLKEKLVDHLGNGSKLGVDIDYVFEEEPLGTGGAVKNAESFFESEKNFVVSNGDVITNLRLDKLLSSDRRISTISLTPLKSPFGIVETDEEKVIGFKEKPFVEGYWLNAGMYLMSDKIFDFLPENGSIELVTFPNLVKEKQLGYVKFNDVYWRSVDSLKDFEEVSSDLGKDLVFNSV